MPLAAHALAAVVLALPAQAPAEPLDAAAAVAEAERASAFVGSAAAEVARAEAELTDAQPWLPNPAIEARVETGLFTGSPGELDVDVGVSQELRWPGIRSAARAAAEARMRAALAHRARALAVVRAEVGAGLVHLAAAVDVLQLRADLRETARVLQEAADRRLQAGTASAADANIAAIELAAADGALADARADVDTARATLCSTLGRAACGPLVATWPAPPQLGVDVDVNDDDVLLARARAARTDVAAAAERARAAALDVDAAELARLPPVTVGLGYMFRRGTIDAPALGPSIIQADHLLGASISVPLPIFSQGGGPVARARAEALAAEAERGMRARAVDVEVRSAIARRRAAVAAAEAWRDAVPRIDETLIWVTKEYEAGASSIEQYLAARDRLVRARLEALQRRRAATASAFELAAVLDETAIATPARAVDGATVRP